MSIVEKLVTDVAATTLFRASLKLRGLILIPLLTTTLGVEAYGTYVQITIVSGVLMRVFSLGLQIALVNYYDEADPATLYSTVVATGLVTGVVVWAASAALAGEISRLTLGTDAYATLYALGLLLVPLLIGRKITINAFRAQSRIKLHSFVRAVDVYAAVGATAVVVLVLEEGLFTVFVATILTRAAILLVANAYVLFDLGLALPSPGLLGEVLRYALGAMGVDASKKLLGEIDYLAVGFFLGAGAVGVYSVGFKLGQVVLLAARPLTVAFLPEFGDLWERGEVDEIRRRLVAGARYVVTLGIPAAVAFWIVGDRLLALIAPADVAARAPPIAAAVALGIVFLGLTDIYTQVFLAVGDSGAPFRIHLAGLATNVLLLAVLVPAIGVLGAAAAYAATYLLVYAITFVASQRIVASTTPVRGAVRCAAAAGVMAAVLVTIETGVVGFVVAGVATYFAALFVISPAHRQDTSYLLEQVASSVG